MFSTTACRFSSLTQQSQSANRKCTKCLAEHQKLVQRAATDSLMALIVSINKPPVLNTLKSLLKPSWGPLLWRWGPPAPVALHSSRRDVFQTCTQPREHVSPALVPQINLSLHRSDLILIRLLQPRCLLKKPPLKITTLDSNSFLFLLFIYCYHDIERHDADAPHLQLSHWLFLGKKIHPPCLFRVKHCEGHLGTTVSSFTSVRACVCVWTTVEERPTCALKWASSL